MTFIDTFLDKIKPDDVVLDVGAGDGKYAEMMVARGASVFAIDKQKPEKMIPGVEWHIGQIENWIEQIDKSIKFNAVFAKNIIQFFDTQFVVEKLLPKLSDHLTSGGFIAIETFYRAPEPSFSKPHRSYYSSEDLMKLFSDWKIVFSNSFEKEAKDMKGIPRKFSITQIIVQKP